MDMSRKKKQVRQAFRDRVFARDGYRCVGCGRHISVAKAQEELDAHHITNRREMPNGGYVRENGASLCKNGRPSCHEKAEVWLQKNQGAPGYSPQELYEKIGSSYEKAYQASLTQSK